MTNDFCSIATAKWQDYECNYLSLISGLDRQIILCSYQLCNYDYPKTFDYLQNIILRQKICNISRSEMMPRLFNFGQVELLNPVALDMIFESIYSEIESRNHSDFKKFQWRVNIIGNLRQGLLRARSEFPSNSDCIEERISQSEILQVRNTLQWFSWHKELELHRMSRKVAIETIYHCFVNETPWDCIRIVYGGRSHDRQYALATRKGSLHDLINDIFINEDTDWRGLNRECLTKVLRIANLNKHWNTKITFYSGETALEINKQPSNNTCKAERLNSSHMQGVCICS